MRLSSNEVESRNHCIQLTVKPHPLTLSSGSVPDWNANIMWVVRDNNKG